MRAYAGHDADASRRQLLEHAADLHPAAPGIWADLARAALADGDLVAAGRYTHEALERDANDLAAWLVDAQLAAQKSDWKRALEQIDEVARRSPVQLAQAARAWPSQLQPPKSTTGVGRDRTY